MLKRYLASALLIFFTLLLLSISANASDKAEAVSIRLASAPDDGVTITTSAGKEVTAKENMRLLRGYQVMTDISSYAYMSLDDTKLVKTDINTHVEIRKKGKLNEIYLRAGQIFFNVTEKLQDDETMTISTSNITMGIYGSSGLIKTEIASHEGNMITRVIVHFYEGGSVTLVRDPITGETRTIELTGNELLIIGDTTRPEDGFIEVLKISVDDVPSFVIKELLADDGLMERFTTSTSITAEELADILDEQIAKEKAALQVKIAEMERAQEIIDNLGRLTQLPSPLATSPPSSGESTPSSGESTTSTPNKSTPPSQQVQPPPQPPQTDIAPSVPRNFTITPGDGKVTLSWEPPINNGSSAITKYQISYGVTSGYSENWSDIPGSNASTVSHVVEGLTNGIEYTFAIRAVNNVGNSGTVQRNGIPITVPWAPQNLSLTPGNGKVLLKWEAPANNGGSAIIKYQITYGIASANSQSWIDIPGSNASTVSYIVEGLTNGMTYPIGIRAVNMAGGGGVTQANVVPGNIMWVNTGEDLDKVGIASHPYYTTPAGYEDWTLDANYIQIADITLPAGSSNHMPIGDGSSFNGTYDGNGYTIYNLNIEAHIIHRTSLGLFSEVSVSGVVKNVTLSGSYVYGGSDTGGVVGKNNGTVSNCVNIGDVGGGSDIGGVVGSNTGTVANCINIGNVSGTSSVGGIVGSNNYGTVTRCYNAGNGSVMGERNVGGVVGWHFGNYVRECRNSAEVLIFNIPYSTGPYQAIGGVVGWLGMATAEYCYNEGKVNGNTATGIGGILGISGGHDGIYHCYNTGDVIGEANVGGISGYSSDSLGSCVALNANLTAISNTMSAGRIAGSGGGYDNYARTDMVVEVAGTPLTPITPSLTGIHGADVSAGTGANQYNNKDFWETTMGWDFNTVWTWGTNNLPTLRNLPAVP